MRHSPLCLQITRSGKGTQKFAIFGTKHTDIATKPKGKELILPPYFFMGKANSTLVHSLIFSIHLNSPQPVLTNHYTRRLLRCLREELVRLKAYLDPKFIIYEQFFKAQDIPQMTGE